MNYTSRLRVFSSSRKIKEYFNQNKASNALLDKAININEFLENVCLKDATKANCYESLILMNEACLKTKELQEKLGIPSEFFAFLKNNEYLFSFFKELSLEKKEISDLKNNDFYASYNEHLEILDEVYKKYLCLLDENKLYDDMSLAKNYELNKDFLDEYEEIYYDLQGFLSKFEQTLLQELSSCVSVTLAFKTSKFNLVYLSNLEFLKHFNLEQDCFYEINLSKNLLIKKEKLKVKTQEVNVKAFELRTLQCAFVKDEISKFIRAGIKPENIIVITPDEDFCVFLRAFNDDNMLNFASGISIKESLFYHKLKALYESLNNLSFNYKNDQAYFENKEQIFDYHNSMLHLLKLNFLEAKELFETKNFEYFNKLVLEFLEDENTELKLKVQNEINILKEFNTRYDLTIKQLFELFFIQGSSIKTSFTKGGAVTVMGLLESRGLSFDAVVIVDFNDEFIPKKSINELFLNNQVRKKAGLISYETRENLQRFYYENLIKNAKKVSISYVENEEKSKSRFLEELNLAYKSNQASQKAYLQALSKFKTSKINLNKIQAPSLKHNLFEKPLSFSRLDLFLNSKRTYYYKYILNLSPARLLNIENNKKEFIANKGKFIHKMLELYYQNNSTFDEYTFFTLLEKEYSKYFLDALDLELLKLKFKDFKILEKSRFDKGYKIHKTELKIDKTIKLKNKTIKLTGIIDRIDLLDDKALILDYKSSKIPSNSFQLAFYELLYECFDAFFYDLKNMKLLKNKAKTKQELLLCLEELNSDEKIEFENKSDEFCPYKLLYKKELK